VFDFQVLVAQGSWHKSDDGFAWSGARASILALNLLAQQQF